MDDFRLDAFHRSAGREAVCSVGAVLVLFLLSVLIVLNMGPG